MTYQHKNNIFNIIKSNRLEGASTITQQVAKNFLLSNEISLDRKVKEAILAFRIEKSLSKKVLKVENLIYPKALKKFTSFNL